MPLVTAPDYRDENAASCYPFADDASLAARDGLMIPQGTFIDATVYPIGGQEGCGIREIDVAVTAVTIWIGDAAQPRRASAQFDPTAPPTVLTLVDPLGRPAGLLLADPAQLAAAQTWGLGSHLFATGAATFVATCAIPTPEPCLRGLLTADGLLATGDVWLVGENGIVLTVDPDGAIRIDAVGDPLFVRRLCAVDGLYQPARKLLTINGGVPVAGRFTINVGSQTPDTVLRIYPVPPDQVVIAAMGRSLGG